MRYMKMGDYMNMTYRERAFAGEKNIVMDALKSLNSNATIIGIAAVVKNKPDDIGARPREESKEQQKLIHWCRLLHNISRGDTSLPSVSDFGIDFV